ncbi:hypothetical protein WN943_014445 [Citrus x changshan-huyou]
MESAAQVRDVDALYELIRHDRYFLDNFDEKPFVDTPLHAAARDGNVEWSMEIIRLKPSFARKLNQDGFSPVHLALQNDQTHLVLQLIDIDPDLVRVQGREGITPLHFVSEKGDIHLLREFLSACPKSLEDVTNKGETALHIALKNDKVEAFDQALTTIDRVPFMDTPLHIAASMGHVNFALEIMRLKPSFARKQNQYGFSPLHLALQKKDTQMVRRLIDVDRNLVRVQGREGVTPLHYVAEKGNVDLLCKLLEACPESITEVTIRKETALHVAAKNDQLEAVECMLGWLRYVDMEDILNWTDDEGNTLLHITISKSQIKA